MNLFTFKPLLKQTIWGGEKIIKFKQLNVNQPSVGESWEISGVPEHESVVADGPHKGETLNQLVAEMKEQLVGKANYQRFGNEFPLLIKFIDARQDLSIQVHPSDEIAKQQGHERGKTEMWYIMESDPEAHLRAGLKHQITPEEYKQMVEDDTICDAIADYKVSEGNCFFLPAGRIHSIGKGCFLAEIQQTSDVTYRIYDFKRRDKNGNLRQLHTQEAAECIDYHALPDYQTHYVPLQNQRVELITCPYFTTSVYDITQPTVIDYSQRDSFIILIATKGEAVITNPQDENDAPFTLCAGQTVLLPATMQAIKVSGTIKFLETYV